ncbi:ribulose 1,5-bisphosphate carboxylase small subunit [Roseibium sp. TrichSKD4]|nr:ribulose 1,5-bisphosphate carboxylase small subunit [Roseibium sp. TrichSKD4]
MVSLFKPQVLKHTSSHQRLVLFSKLIRPRDQDRQKKNTAQLLSSNWLIFYWSEQ